jgi:hypothetical protein
MKRRALPHRPAASRHPKQPTQLSTPQDTPKQDQASVWNDEFAREKPDEGSPPSLVAMQPAPSTHPPSPRRQSAGRSGSRRRAKKKPGNRLGGWAKTSSLQWADVKEIHEAHHAATKAGMPLNRFVSIRPPSHITDEALRKKLCYRRVSHLAQKLRRRGVSFVAVRVFEKDIGGMLHVHLLVHVPRHLLKEFDSWGDLIVTDIRPASPAHIGYITKQRHPLPPDLEKVVSHRRKKGEPFRGRRWSLTPDLKALMSGCDV